MKKPVYKKWWFWVVIILVIGGIGNMIDPVEKKEDVPVAAPEVKPKEEPKKDEPKKENPDKEVKQDKSVKEIAESTAGKQFEKIELINFNEDNGFLLIRAEGKESLTTSFTVKGFKLAIIDTLKDIRNEKEIKTAAFNITYPLVDKYGNSTNQNVLKVEFSRDTIDKINYDNFNIDNMESVADSYWEHQAIKE